MKRFLFPHVVVACLASLPVPTYAQGFYQRPQVNPSSRPTVSPYLNLARGGNSAVNYYGLVRPQVETARSIQSLQQQIGQPPGPPVAEEDSMFLPATGHPTQFLNYARFFPLLTSGRTATASAPTLGARRR